jgi:hypothetical protein
MGILDKCHNIRNLGEYQGDLNVDVQLVKDLIGACRKVTAEVEALKLPGKA